MFDERYIEEYLQLSDLTHWIWFKYHNHFRDKEYRNDWSLLCAARDWIHVAVRYLNSHPLPRRRAQSMEVLSYILSIGNIVEAVDKMHIAIFCPQDPVFYGENDCFPDNCFQMNDWNYFKRLRACFGVHPVDIGKNGEEKRFASWSGDFESSGGFSVRLYSGEVDGKDMDLRIDFNQLNRFVKKYYEHLPVLKAALPTGGSLFRAPRSRRAAGRSCPTPSRR